MDAKPRLRSVVQAIIGARRISSQACTLRSYALDATVDSETISSMDKDIPRTAQGDPLVAARIGIIRAVLLRHLAEDRELGYCQGMNLVAAVFAVASKDQDEAYQRFYSFVQRVRGLWLLGFPLLDTGTAKFISMASDRSWFHHMQALGVETTMFLPQAFMTMLSMWLPMSTMVQCLRLIEKSGLDGMVALSVAVLDQAEVQLLAQRRMEGLLHELSNIRAAEALPKELKSAAKSLLLDQRIARERSLRQQSWNGMLNGLQRTSSRVEDQQPLLPSRTSSARFVSARQFSPALKPQHSSQWDTIESIFSGLFNLSPASFFQESKIDETSALTPKADVDKLLQFAGFDNHPRMILKPL